MTTSVTTTATNAYLPCCTIEANTPIIEAMLVSKIGAGGKCRTMLTHEIPC